MGEGVGSILPDGWIKCVICLFFCWKNTYDSAKKGFWTRIHSLAKIIQREKFGILTSVV